MMAADDRRQPPPLSSGVPARALEASRTASTRLPPRDTEAAVRDAIRDLERDLERLGEGFANDLTRLTERLDARLGNGAETLTRLDERVGGAERAAGAAAELARQAATPTRTPWLRLIPIVVVLASLGATALLATARKVDSDKFDAYAERADARERALLDRTAALERDLAAARAEASTLQAAIAAVDLAIKREARAAPRRTP